MNKLKGIVLCALLLISAIATAQDVKVKEVMIKKGSGKIPGFVATYRHSRAATKDAIRGATATMGLKHTHHKKGWYFYKGAVWQSISPNKGDYYYKVRGKKKKAKVYFIASKGYDNYVTSATDGSLANNINAFLQDLNARIAAMEKIQELQQGLQEIPKPANK